MGSEAPLASRIRDSKLKAVGCTLSGMCCVSETHGKRESSRLKAMRVGFRGIKTWEDSSSQRAKSIFTLCVRALDFIIIAD
jgi:hypothetical protein